MKVTIKYNHPSVYMKIRDAFRKHRCDVLDHEQCVVQLYSWEMEEKGIIVMMDLIIYLTHRLGLTVSLKPDFLKTDIITIDE